MELTRRGWTTAGCGVLLVAGAFAFDAPALLFAAAAVGAVLAGVQFAFVRRLVAERDGLTAGIDVERRNPAVDEPTAVTLSVDRASPSLPLRVTLPASGAAVSRPTTVDLGPDDAGATAVEPIAWTVAGTYRLGPLRGAATDPLGLFVAAFELDIEETIRVRPHRPSTTHLGRGGKRVASAFGEHRGGTTGAGIDPAELRAYRPGDDVARIDWKATARLDEVYVTDTEAETDRRTVLLLDHRATMGIGDADATPLAYLRHVALALVESARDLGDPLGLYAVGDDGVTVAEPPSTAPGGYDRLAGEIRDLQPTRGPTRDAASAVAVRTETDGGVAYGIRTAARLEGSDDRFARRLYPLLSDATPYLNRVEDDPLFAAARAYLSRLRGTLWTVIVTDDARREELVETVNVARRGHDRVLVVLAPRALFAADGLADLDRAYRRYAAFESFRRDLASMDRVDALELAPGDRIEAVLESGGERR